MTANEERFYAEEVRHYAMTTIFGLVNLANALQRLGMDEDCKQVLETACDVCGHAHDAFITAQN